MFQQIHIDVLNIKSEGAPQQLQCFPNHMIDHKNFCIFFFIWDISQLSKDNKGETPERFNIITTHLQLVMPNIGRCCASLRCQWWSAVLLIKSKKDPAFSNESV